MNESEMIGTHDIIMCKGTQSNLTSSNQHQIRPVERDT
jgi:hypothetical protein